jgi:cysteine desulfurase
MSIYNTEEEINFVIDKIPSIIEKLRNLSPYWKPNEQACATGA